jgi:hypothetical protein
MTTAQTELRTQPAGGRRGASLSSSGGRAAVRVTAAARRCIGRPPREASASSRTIANLKRDAGVHAIAKTGGLGHLDPRRTLRAKRETRLIAFPLLT